MASSRGAAVKQPFIEHIYELRRRLFISVLAVFVGSIIGYMLTDRLLDILQSPLHQKLYYTSPTGAFSFVVKLCVSFGIIVALPIIIHQLIRFLSPLMHSITKRQLTLMTVSSFLLAIGGITFAYFLSLPGALKFLTNFHAGSIQSLITADEYFNFVITYLLGAAILFQLPLIMIVINKVTPLKPTKLLSIERYVIVGSFVLGALLTPTPDPVNQALMSVPIILMYQIGVGLVWLINRKGNKRANRLTKLQELVAQDSAKYANRGETIHIATLEDYALPDEPKGSQEEIFDQVPLTESVMSQTKGNARQQTTQATFRPKVPGGLINDIG